MEDNDFELPTHSELMWRPIETAPKDGTRILVLFRDQPFVAEYVPVISADNLHWCVREPSTALEAESKIVQVIDRHRRGETHRYGGLDGPTHWLPIPAFSKSA